VMGIAPDSPRPRVAIVGSGFSGLCLGNQLKKAGIRSFRIFEKSASLGGTWRDNTYPGAACDSPSFSYCFSFEQKTDWSRKWAPQAEILAYMEHCAEKYGLLPHIRFETEITSARFNVDRGVWQLRTATGEELEAEILVTAVGQLNRPSTPDIPGLDLFLGERFHSAQWHHDCTLAGKRVAVVGNAASAIQFAPRIASEASQLTIFQRSANWMMPKGDRECSEAEKRRFGAHPGLAKLYRWWVWLTFEARYPVFRRSRLIAPFMARLAEKSMRQQVKDPALQDALVPHYPIGGKRILISDDYYASLNRENVEVVTQQIDHFSEEGVVTEDGRDHPADVVIFATGFESTDFLAPMSIQGRDGHTLENDWENGAEAYLGLTVSGFPNLFMTYGPNTNLGHNSIIFMIECQTRYIVDCIEELKRRDLAWIDVRPEVMKAYNARLQGELARTAWAATADSWYKTEGGKITNNWSGTTTRYWWKTRNAKLRDFDQQPRSSQP
jgi:cation diffusion facilitator CzcD-associated flavoprotein CzcO